MSEVTKDDFKYDKSGKPVKETIKEENSYGSTEATYTIENGKRVAIDSVNRTKK